MVCKNGHENPEEAKFCGVCGQPLTAHEKPSKTEEMIPEKPPRKSKGIIIGVALAVVVLAVLLFGGSPAKDVEKAIDAIGTVSLDSLEAIEAAEALFEELTDSQKEKVSNLDVLEDAREAYALLVQEQYKKEANADIDNIVNMVKSQNYEKAKLRMASHSKKIEDEAFEQKLGASLVQALCAEAEKQYAAENYWMAMNLAQHCADFSKYCSESETAAAEALVETYTTELAARTPKNGEILDRTYAAGRNTFTIKAGKYDVCFKLELADNPEKYIVVYVKANEKTRLNILNGKYIAKFTSGPIWYGEEEMFGPDATYYQDPDTMETAGYTSSDAIHWHEWTYTINPDAGWGDQNIDPKDF